MHEPIKIHSQADFEAMRKSGRLTAILLDQITDIIVPGMSTEDIDKFCYDFMIAHNATPATLGYHGYPKSCCTSVNHVACHGIPDKTKKLKNGDIINVDVALILDGWYGDSSRMYVVGDKCSIKAKKLIQVTYECMMIGINMVKPGVRLGDIGAAIENHALKNRMSIVEEFAGHGIGQKFHAAPEVLHYGEYGTGPVLKEGMFFTIEPILNLGRPECKILNDGWTAVTKDKSLSAQFEHTIGVTDKGAEIFTLSPEGYSRPPYK